MGCINCFDKFILLIWLPICTAPIAKCEASEHRRAQSIIKQQEARDAEQHQMIDVGVRHPVAFAKITLTA